MRWIVAGLVCLTVLLSIIDSSPQLSSSGPPPPEAATIPGLRVDSTIIDVGLLAPDAKARASFQFTNTGRRPLEIVKVVPECGCTSIDLAQTQIAPGESLSLPVRVDARSAGSQSFQKHIKVHFQTGGESPQKSVTLGVKGKVDQSRRFFALPGVLDFGSVSSGRTVRIPVDFFGSRSVLNALPDEVQCKTDEPTRLTLRCDHPVPEAGVKTVEFQLTCGESAAGSLRSQVVVAVNGPQPHRMVLPLKARVRATIDVTPRRVLLAPPDPIKESYVDLTLDSPKGEPLAINEVTCDFPLQWSVLDTGSPHRVVIRLRPQASTTSTSSAAGLLRIELESPRTRLIVPAVRITRANVPYENERFVRGRVDRLESNGQ